MISITSTDPGAAALSTACIVHCIGFPILALGLPIFGLISEVEFVHRVLALLTILASGSVAWRAPNARKVSFMLPAAIGGSLIITGLFAESIGLKETIPTLSGGLLIAGAHLKRIKHPHTSSQDRF